MTLRRFKEIWTHRYHKIIHIVQAHISARQSHRYLNKIKQGLQPGQRLIGIIRTEHFGDIVATEPISRQIRALHPNDHLVWFVKPSFAELISTNPNINTVHREFCVTEREILLKNNLFDHIYELQFRNNSHCKMCNKFLDNHIALSKGIDSLNYFNFGNLIEVFTNVANLPLPPDQQPQLYLQATHKQKVDLLHLPAHCIVFHGKSNYYEKDWPAQNWQKLVTWLVDILGYPVVEIGLESVLDGFRSEHYYNLCGQLSILETAEVIKRGKYFIGLDSGPSHLANATGTFGFVLMGNLVAFKNYNPFSGSYGNETNCLIIREEGKTCSEMSYEHVFQTIKEQLSMQGTGER